MDQLERVSAETDSARGTEATLGTWRSPAVVARQGACCPRAQKPSSTGTMDGLPRNDGL